MSPQRKKPEDVVDNVLRRAKLAKIARRLQNCLALAQFKTELCCEDLSFDAIELAFEEEIQQKYLAEYNFLSCSAPLTTQLPYSYALPSLSHEPDPSSHVNGYTNHRKRTLFTSFEESPSSPSKRSRRSLTANKPFGDCWEGSEESARLSDIEQSHHRRITSLVQHSPSPSPAAPADDDFPSIRFFNPPNIRPPLMAMSPSTPLQKNNMLGSIPSIIPPDDGKPFATTPDQCFDLADFINETPVGPVQNPRRTPATSPITP
ncbi:hypothetical protein B0T10DRAFT_417951 [Thelonectria olida]|uniref:Uncharacterized protein n=1 Tax=Thelonectria olida TaxID=1576542 RepID=A0A9P8VQV3_9HYPO|nr:hypothetical protein B0T10DRAFT_417951 [Thelonectria olida]